MLSTEDAIYVNLKRLFRIERFDTGAKQMNIKNLKHFFKVFSPGNFRKGLLYNYMLRNILGLSRNTALRRICGIY